MATDVRGLLFHIIKASRQTIIATLTEFSEVIVYSWYYYRSNVKSSTMIVYHVQLKYEQSKLVYSLSPKVNSLKDLENHQSLKPKQIAFSLGMQVFNKTISHMSS